MVGVADEIADVDVGDDVVDEIAAVVVVVDAADVAVACGGLR